MISMDDSGTDEDFWITQSTTKRAECEARKSEEGRDEENCCLAGLLDDVEVEKRIQKRIPKNSSGVKEKVSDKRYPKFGYFCGWR